MTPNRQLHRTVNGGAALAVVSSELIRWASGGVVSYLKRLP